MNLDQFSQLVNSLERPVILLEGKRRVLAEDEPRLAAIGAQLAAAFPQAEFRSGNADGADYLFAQGVAGVDAGRFAVITPTATHKQKNIPAGAKSYSLSDVTEFGALLEVSDNRDYRRLAQFYIDCLGKAKTPNSARGAYLLRDALKVVGSVELGLAPANIALFYDDLAQPASGGTGFTMSVCRHCNLRLFDQSVWFSFLT